MFENFQEIENLSVYCLIDEFNHYQLPHIVEFSQRLGGKISQAVLEKCEVRKINKRAKYFFECYKNYISQFFFFF